MGNEENQKITQKITVAIDGAIATAEDKSRSRLPRGVIWQQYDRSEK